MNRRFLILTLSAVALVGAACSSTTSSSSTTTSAPSTSTTSMATTTTKTNWCSTSSLTITAGEPSGAAGHVMMTLNFKNTSTTTCVTGGFPGVAGTNSSGAQIVQATRVGSSNGTINLAPGSTATATVTAVNVPSGNETSCPTLAGLVVTPPNTVANIQIIAALPGCPGMAVSAMSAG